MVGVVRVEGEPIIDKAGTRRRGFISPSDEHRTGWALAPVQQPFVGTALCRIAYDSQLTASFASVMMIHVTRINGAGARWNDTLSKRDFKTSEHKDANYI
jgi:hypothetical protein